MWLDDQATALYRLYDEAGTLLYVGITVDVDERMYNHSLSKKWWPEVAHRSVQWHDTRPLALKAETEAIRAERPRYNVAGSPDAPGPRELEANEITEGQVRDLARGLDLGAVIVDPVFVVNRKQERHRVAAIVSMDFYEQALAALGLETVAAPPKKK